MASVTAPDGEVFTDGLYAGICSREKVKRNFRGLVSLTEASRIVATGPCTQCGTATTRVLYTP